MGLYDMELEDAAKRLRDNGKSPDDFTFARTFLEPDPDGGGMFTVQYEVRIANVNTGKEMSAIGGIGWAWVDRFAEALAEGHFD